MHEPSRWSLYIFQYNNKVILSRNVTKNFNTIQGYFLKSPLLNYYIMNIKTESIVIDLNYSLIYL